MDILEKVISEFLSSIIIILIAIYIKKRQKNNKNDKIETFKITLQEMKIFEVIKVAEIIFTLILFLGFVIIFLKETRWIYGLKQNFETIILIINSIIIVLTSFGPIHYINKFFIKIYLDYKRIDFNTYEKYRKRIDFDYFHGVKIEKTYQLENSVSKYLLIAFLISAILFITLLFDIILS